jgi:hypothetical protein
MADETLLTAARRVVRFFNIDMNAGGIVTPQTQHAVETLDRMVRKEVHAEEQQARKAKANDAMSVQLNQLLESWK